jgi:hypothetical protein
MLRTLVIRIIISRIIPINNVASASLAFEGVKHAVCVGAPWNGNSRINPDKGNSENVQNDNLQLDNTNALYSQFSFLLLYSGFNILC